MRKQIPEDNPIGHLTNPIVTGGAVIALKCREGVIIATDTLLSYGGLLSTSALIKSITALIDMRLLLITWSLQLLESSLISRRRPAN